MKRHALLLTVLLTTPALADDQADFDRAGALVQQRHYAQALEIYQRLLPDHPDSAPLLQVTANAAFRAGQLPLSLDLWQRLEKLGETRDTVQGLLLVYQALGRLPERDREQARLQQLWENTTDSTFQSETGYLRDLFTIGNTTVFCVQFFRPIGAQAILYDFTFRQEGKSELDPGKIALESDQFDTDLAREQKQIGPNDRAYSLDGYTPGGHQTWDLYLKQPLYEDVKKEVIDIYLKKRKPAASSHG